jgi:hypothetical protein
MAASWATGVMASPTALLTGLPWHGGSTRWLASAVSSAILWLAVGGWSAQRAVRHPMATWREYWREYRWLAGAIGLGAIVGLGVMGLLALSMP